jgi:hypothetical protein
VTKRLLIAFADTAEGVQGIAIAGAGALLATPDGVRALPGPGPAARAAGGFELAVHGELELAFEPAGGARGHVGATAVDGAAAILEIDDDGGRALTRAVAIFLGPVTLALSATRPPGARGHGEERLSAVLVEGDPPAALEIADPRLSTTYDGEGRVIHCGLELWESEESEFPRRAAGEASAHGELTHAGVATTRVAFLDCHGDGGRRGPGVYAITTPVS